MNCSFISESYLLLYTVTDDDDLPDTIKELTDVIAYWRNIGIHLGIRDSQLEVIQLQGHNPLDCMRQMLSTWLRRSYNVERFGEPTWMKLVEAVGHSAGGGNPHLAMKIAKRHGGITYSSVADSWNMHGTVVMSAFSHIVNLSAHVCLFLLVRPIRSV